MGVDKQLVEIVVVVPHHEHYIKINWNAGLNYTSYFNTIVTVEVVSMNIGSNT